MTKIWGLGGLKALNILGGMNDFTDKRGRARKLVLSKYLGLVSALAFGAHRVLNTNLNALKPDLPKNHTQTQKGTPKEPLNPKPSNLKTKLYGLNFCTLSPWPQTL